MTIVEKVFKIFVLGIDFVCFYDFPIKFWIKCSDDTIFLFSILLELKNEIFAINNWCTKGEIVHDSIVIFENGEFSTTNKHRAGE